MRSGAVRPRLARRLMPAVPQCRAGVMTDRSGGIPRSFMRDFISLYKALPCLWNPKARDFTYRSSKAAAYNVLVEKYREVDPGASKETVQQRLSSLRNCRRKELKKVKAAKELGEIYTPQLWYYNLMSFIDDPEDQDCDEIGGNQGKLDQEEPPHSFEDGSIIYAADSPAASHDSSGVLDIERNNKPIKRCREEDEDEDEIFRFLKQRVKTLKTPHQTPTSPGVPTATNHARYHHLAEHWAEKLAGLRGEQRIFAEKLINDTFYEAEFGRLGHGCRIVPFS